MNNLVLKEACITGLPIRVGIKPTSWTVRGSRPSVCYPLLRPISTNKSWTRAHFNLGVEDVTGDSEADLVMNGGLGCFTGSGAPTNQYVRIHKTGAGTVRFDAMLNIQAMEVELCAGTWLLGTSSIAKDTTPYTLAGGTLAAADGTSNATMGTLAVAEEGGGISLGSGATLAFSDSSSQTWSGKIKIYGFAEKAIRFGSSRAAVANTHAFVDEDGKPLWVDKSG